MLMVMGLVSAVAQGGLSGPLTRRWGESKVIKASLLLSATGFLLIMLANSYGTLLLSIGFFILVTALMIPALTSLTSKVTTMEQGITMGLSNSSMSLGRIAGPLWGGFVFDLNLRYPLLSGAAIMLGSFVVSLICLRNREKVLGAGLQAVGHNRARRV